MHHICLQRSVGSRGGRLERTMTVVHYRILVMIPVMGYWSIDQDRVTPSLKEEAVT